jgi:hypothetical protein
MRYAQIVRTAAGLFALALASVVAAQGAAQAQSFPSLASSCTGQILFDPPAFFGPDPDGLGPLPAPLIDPPPTLTAVDDLYECGEAAGAVAGVANNLVGIGEGLVQQQLNFATGFGSFATPTGRIRSTSHQGLTEKGTGNKTEDFDIGEGSVFANGTYDMPGTTFGGKLRFSGLAGYDKLHQKSESGSYTTDIDAFIYGGSYLWSSGSFYSMTLIVGFAGEADTSNAGGSYDYDVTGYYSNSVVGNTFDLGAVKFDTRVGVGHHDIDGGRFTVPGTVTTLKGSTEAWNGTLTGTLFTIVDVGDGAVARPYLLGSYKHVFDEDIEIRGSDGNLVSFEQGQDYGRAEVGFDVVQGIYTFGAAFYDEFSEDQNTVGGRLGLSVKLQ